MNILIYAYNYHPEPIGIAPLMTELAEGLVHRGHGVRVVTAMPNYPQRVIYPEYQGKTYLTENRNGVQIQRCYVWIRPKPGLLTRILLDGSFVVMSLWPALRGQRPDVILYTTPPLPVAVPVALLGLWYRCPAVLSLQDILPEAAVHVGLVTNPIAIRIFEILERFSYGISTRISVITEKFTENLRNKGVRESKITCIPNWVDVNFVKPLPQVDNPFRQKYNLNDRFVLLYSGNIALTQDPRVRNGYSCRKSTHAVFRDLFCYCGRRKSPECLTNLLRSFRISTECPLVALPTACGSSCHVSGSGCGSNCPAKKCNFL